MCSFPIHGTVKLDVDDRILLVEGIGPWNRESVKAAEKPLKPLLAQLLGKKWGALVVLYGEPIYVPEAALLLTKNIRAEKKQGRVATAVIVVESKSPEFAKSHLSQIYKNAGETVRFFTDRQEAHWWLVQQISQFDLAKH